MHRPRFVSDAVVVMPDGRHVGQYRDVRVSSAYQPIFRATGGELSLCGFEGLVRCERAGAPLSPDQLFALAEADDRLFVECMCRALHIRNYRLAAPEGLLLFLNVNPAIYESVSIIEREFEFMFSILAQYGLSPDRLVCELVEEEALSEPTLVQLCAKFRSFGARIAVDDFGVGSSGVVRFRALRPEILKIDGEMFRRMAAQNGGRRMLRAMSRTMRSEGTTILVEGIETAEQLAFARDIGATLFQGYGLARPERLPFGFHAKPGLRFAEPATAAAVAG